MSDVQKRLRHDSEREVVPVAFAPNASVASLAASSLKSASIRTEIAGENASIIVSRRVMSPMAVSVLVMRRDYPRAVRVIRRAALADAEAARSRGVLACAKCGYDMAGLERHAICPECGGACRSDLSVYRFITIAPPPGQSSIVLTIGSALGWIVLAALVIGVIAFIAMNH